jgi:ATP-dependent DNA helicase RecQ
MKNIKHKKEQLNDLMKIHYGFDKFRAGQEKAIDNVLQGKSSVVIMPTGKGKSLCYQLPALVLEGVTIVVSPLIALMKDQVDSLEANGIPATFINSTLSLKQAEERLNQIKEGQYKLVYIAPERFYNREFVNALQDIKVSLIAIDEAHCISQWGHDFRPSYTRLNEAVKLLGNPTVLALTATATPEVKNDIVKQLDLKNPEMIITGFARPNLQLGVIRAREVEKPQFVIDAIMSAPNSSGIIYVSTRARAENLTAKLLTQNIEAAYYHAGMQPEDRKWVQESFLKGKTKVIVATNAFGLGINKPDIRFVIHYDMPGTVEAYYQEAGRAGRDNKPSFCLLLYNSRDRYLHEFFIKGDNPPPHVIKEIYDTLLNFESDTVLITYAQLSEMLSDDVPEMAIGTSLKILERNGYISRSREKNGNAYIKFFEEFSKSEEKLSSKAKKQKEILKDLFERYSNELLKGFEINIEEVADLLQIKKESLSRAIRKYVELGICEYRPPFKGTEIRILKRANSEDLDIDEKSLKDKLKRAFVKLDKIEDYIYAYGCRQRYILDYFGDVYDYTCEKCDNCLNHDNNLRYPKRDYKKDINPKKFLRVEKEFEVAPPKKDSMINTKLTQLETLELYNEGLSIKEISKERKLKEDTIINHLVFLIEKKILKNKDINKLVDKNIQNKILKAAKKVGDAKLKPIYEELDGKVSYDDIKLTLAIK